jgi:hypothetical protein
MPLQRDYPFTVALNVGVDLVLCSGLCGGGGNGCTTSSYMIEDMCLCCRERQNQNVTTPRTVTGVRTRSAVVHRERVMIACQRSDIELGKFYYDYMRAVYKVSCKGVIMKETSRCRNVYM